MIIDSHCHLEYEPMSSSLNETIARANKEGVKYLLTISTTDKSLIILNGKRPRNNFSVFNYKIYFIF